MDLCFEGGKAATAVRPLCRLNINTAEAAIDAAVAGVGLTNVLSYQVAQAVHDGRLRIVLQDHEPDPIPVHLIHAGRSLLPLKMRSFLEFAAPRLRKSLAREQQKLVARRTDHPSRRNSLIADAVVGPITSSSRQHVPEAPVSRLAKGDVSRLRGLFAATARTMLTLELVRMSGCAVQQSEGCAG